MSGAIQRVVSFALRVGAAAFALALCIHGSTKRPARTAAPARTVAQTAATADAVTDEDVARGWRLVSVSTNAAPDFAMPADGTVRGKWHLRGAYEDATAVDFGDWKFPAGTGGTSRVWAFAWGRLRPALRDAVHEIRAVDAPMSAIPSVSRLWTSETAVGGRLVTWERFALGRLRVGEPLTAGRTVSAQVELHPNGDFATRSNGVERTYVRVDPDDWDGDGWHNDDDPDPRAWTGGAFGPVQVLPPGANGSAYCRVDLVADWNTPVVFAGDGPSDLADPSFTARAGETNRVTLLVGKTYSVTAVRPLRVVGRSPRQVRVEGDGTASLTIRLPVSFRASQGKGGGFAMSVEPTGLGGAFSWTDPCCPLTGYGGNFWFACPGRCACGGCVAAGTYAYEGYSLPCAGGGCPCPVGSDGPRTEPDGGGPREASASVSFSAPAVIFEDAYTNRPGEVVSRRSTRTALSCEAHGGGRGATVAFSLAGAERLARVSGAALPVTRFVPPGQGLAFEVVYEGLLPGESGGDVVARAVCAPEDGSPAATNSAALTPVRVELEAVYEAPENPNPGRHVYGVGEKVRFAARPRLSSVTFSTEKLDAGDDGGDYELFEGNETATADSPRIYTCPISANYRPPLRVRLAGVEYEPSVTIVEPQEIITKEAFGTGLDDISLGDVAMGTLVTRNCVGPMHVSFRGVQVFEVPCENAVPPTGYFATTNFTGFLTHSTDAGAGYAFTVKVGNYWAEDAAGRRFPYKNWSSGRLVWKIPIGWRRIPRGGSALGMAEKVEYERYNDDSSRPLLIGGREDAYLQIFTIESDGTSSVEKFGYKLTRGRWSLKGKVEKQ